MEQAFTAHPNIRNVTVADWGHVFRGAPPPETPSLQVGGSSGAAAAAAPADLATLLMNLYTNGSEFLPGDSGLLFNPQEAGRWGQILEGFSPAGVPRRSRKLLSSSSDLTSNATARFFLVPYERHPDQRTDCAKLHQDFRGRVYLKCEERDLSINADTSECVDTVFLRYPDSEARYATDIAFIGAKNWRACRRKCVEFGLYEDARNSHFQPILTRFLQEPFRIRVNTTRAASAMLYLGPTPCRGSSGAGSDIQGNCRSTDVI